MLISPLSDEFNERKCYEEARIYYRDCRAHRQRCCRAASRWYQCGNRHGRGAATGAIIGGPIGAGVGAVVGATLGGALTPPPPEVVTYVQQQPAPPSVVVQQPIAVGKPVPETVMLTPVPDNPTYAYAVVNEQRLIVEPKSRTVVQVIN